MVHMVKEIQNCQRIYSFFHTIQNLRDFSFDFEQPKMFEKAHKVTQYQILL